MTDSHSTATFSPQTGFQFVDIDTVHTEDAGERELPTTKPLGHPAGEGDLHRHATAQRTNSGRPNVGEFVNVEDDVLTPGDLAELDGVIAAAAASGRQLNVFSTGFNWGLGSSVPTGRKPTSLRLGQLRAIRKIDLTAGYAIIEPGVTQQQLATALAGTDRMLNVTASSAQTSVLGNALDRGVGLRRQRTEDLLGIEVRLADGRTRRMGWWPSTGGAAPYRYGVGPDLLGLFTQSGLGVVTAGVIGLLRRPPATNVISASVDRGRIPQLIGALGQGLALGLINAVPKIYDPGARASYAGDHSGRAVLYVAVDGTQDSIADRTRAAIAHLGLDRPAVDVFAAGEVADTADVITRLVARGYIGDPSTHDDVVRATLGAAPADVDGNGRGWIFLLPLLPADDADRLLAAYAAVAEYAGDPGVTVGATVNLITPDLVDFVISISFDRHTHTQQAHRMLDALHRRFADLDIAPYRLDVAHRQANDSNPNADLLIAIRDLLDPHRRFEAGRYLPADPQEALS
jgi:4-cresol dehydrogenase (hydroxylating)